MEYKTLGKTNIKVSVVALGCEGFMNKSEDEVRKLLNVAKKEGINFIDFYSPNPDARMHVGSVIHEERQDWIIEGHICAIWKDGQYLRTRRIEEVKAGGG